MKSIRPTCRKLARWIEKEANRSSILKCGPRKANEAVYKTLVARSHLAGPRTTGRPAVEDFKSGLPQPGLYTTKKPSYFST